MAGLVGTFFDDRLDGRNVTPFDYLRDWLGDPANRRRSRERLAEAFSLPEAQSEGHINFLANPLPGSGSALAIAAEDALSLLRGYRRNAEEHQKLADASRTRADEERRSGNNAAARRHEDQKREEGDFLKRGAFRGVACGQFP